MDKDDKINLNDDSEDLSMDDFEKAVEESFIKNTFQTGDKVSGKVLSITKDFVFLDIGAKSEGIINAEEFIDESGELKVATGDVIEATVISMKDEILLSFKMRKRDQSRELLHDAYESRIPVQGRVTDVNKGGFVVDLGQVRAFCPISQIDIGYTSDPQIYVGESFHFIITRYDTSGRDIVVSRSALLKTEMEKQAVETLKTLEPGLILQGTVKGIINAGAFVDIGGVDGFVHISELSWDRVEDPADVVTVGQVHSVKVLNVEDGGKRISLSIREVQGNPWDLHVGTDILEEHIYTGEVKRLENYGAFVSILPGIQGLLHISEMTWGKHIRHPKELLKEGERISVKVLSVDYDKKRISLGMKQLSQDPWDNASEYLQSGKILQAEVNRVQSSGLEVTVYNDLSGFIPVSMTGISRTDNINKKFQIGETVSAQIAEVDRKTRRLILKIVNPDETDENTDYEAYMEQTVKPGNSENNIGSFGEILAKAMEKKKQKDK